MPRTTPVRPYHWLAEYYDQLFAVARPWSKAARLRLLTGILPNVESACDLACGTGTTALELAAQGIRMYGVDLSPIMCRQAREKARRAGLPLRVIHADMRNFRLPEPVDLVLCEYDAINHIPRKADLARVARCVSRALRPGGYFYFDANNLLSFQTVWPGTWWLDTPNVAVVMNGGYNRRRESAWSNVTLFIRDGNCWRRREERVEQVCWTPAEVRRTLAAAGLTRLRAWDAAPFFKGNAKVTPGCRSVYLARKMPATHGAKR
jgi:SAM-dependent methyltransferase